MFLSRLTVPHHHFKMQSEQVNWSIRIFFKKAQLYQRGLEWYADHNEASTHASLVSTVSVSELNTCFARFDKKDFSSEAQALFSCLPSTSPLKSSREIA